MATLAFSRGKDCSPFGRTEIVWARAPPGSLLLARPHPAQSFFLRNRPRSRISSVAPALLTTQPALVSNIADGCKILPCSNEPHLSV